MKYACSEFRFELGTGDYNNVERFVPVCFQCHLGGIENLIVRRRAQVLGWMVEGEELLRIGRTLVYETID